MPEPLKADTWPNTSALDQLHGTLWDQTVKEEFTMRLVDDPTGRGRKPGPCTKADEPVVREFLFWFALVPSRFLGTPEERARTTQHRLKVVVAANQLVAANLYDDYKARDLANVVFWFCRRQVAKRLEKGALKAEETVTFDMKECMKECPCDPCDPVALRDQEPRVGAVFVLEVERRICGFAKDPL